MSKKVTARKEREPTVFRIGMSLLNEKVFAGYARGLQFVGNKKVGAVAVIEAVPMAYRALRTA